jgi:hypothetical protein
VTVGELVLNTECRYSKHVTACRVCRTCRGLFAGLAQTPITHRGRGLGVDGQHGEHAIDPTSMCPGHNPWPRGQHSGGRAIHWPVVDRTSSPTAAIRQRWAVPIVVGSVDAFAVDEVIRGAPMPNHHRSRSWRGCAVAARSSPQIESTPAVLRNALQDHSRKISRASDSGLLASIDE